MPLTISHSSFSKALSRRDRRRIRSYLRRRELLTVCLLMLMMGCSSQEPIEKKFRPTLQILNSREESPAVLASQIARSVQFEKNPKGELAARLENIFHPQVRASLLIPLYDEFSRNGELVSVLIRHFQSQPPEELDEKFLEEILRRQEHFSELLEIWLNLGRKEGFPQIEKELMRRANLSPLQMLQLAEVMFEQAKFAKGALALSRALPVLNGHLLQRAEFLNGKLDFYQKDFPSAVEKFKPVLMHGKHRNEMVFMLTDALILMEDLNRAFRYLKVYGTYLTEGDSSIHVMRGKLFLFAKNYRESRKQWERALELGSRSEQSHLLAFFLSHYFPEISIDQMGTFASWKKGRISGTGLGLTRYDIWLDQYSRLSRHDQDLLARLRSRIHQLM